MSLELKQERRFLICGPSGSGKTNFVFRFIVHAKAISGREPKKILFFYQVYQSAFDRYANKVDFRYRLPAKNDLGEVRDGILVLDDIMSFKKIRWSIKFMRFTATP